MSELYVIGNTDDDADWIKLVRGPDGRTARAREADVYTLWAQQVQLKHLPGRHDQSTHAPHARRTGSTPTGKLRAYSELGAQERMDADGGNGRLVLEINSTISIVRREEAPHLGPGMMEFDYSDKQRVRKDIAGNLAVQAGLSKDVVDANIDLWHGSSNDHSLQALSMQQAAAEEFGVSLSEWQADTLEKVVGEATGQRSSWSAAQIQANGRDISYQYAFEQLETEGLVGGYGPPMLKLLEGFASSEYPPEAKARAKAYLRAMYEETQSRLKELGIDQVTVYRGSEQDWRLRSGEQVELRENAMESWSLSEKVADDFGNVTLRAVVPAARILAVPTTGAASLGEYEVVVLAGPEVDRADVVSVREKRD